LPQCNRARASACGLIANALLRAFCAEVMASAMVVVAPGGAGAQFFGYRWFERLTDDPQRLIRAL
jgi:hypothetical protein